MSFKRLNYFYGQFLNEKDFRDEQLYHIKSLSMHNKNLHSWGIASGLDVSFVRGKKSVIVESGMAVDKDGRQMILEEAREIDLSRAAAATVYLTISYREIETDSEEQEGIKGNIRISEDPLIDFSNNAPEDASMKILLAKVILDPEDKTVQSIDLKDRKKIILSGDIEANYIAFILKRESGEWPMIKGIDGQNPGLEVNSHNTIVTGDLKVAGTMTASKISGELGRNMVGTNQLRDEAVSVPKLKSAINVVSVEGTIDALSEIPIATETSNTHLFFMTSVIPTTPGSIEWRWQTEYKNNQLSYILMLKNLSNKSVKYDVRYFDISEK
ncbi:MAG TPA: hypothetical protein VIO11_01525 [Candidatus Methanoperedens sp.]